MPTTTNFGWTTPADTDLVKDGAAAIRTLGSGVDTSFVDLKGGTTGQYLTKATNTDLDFTWKTLDPFIGVKATKSGDQSLSNSTSTAITWDVEQYDTSAIHSTSTNTSRFTVPSGKGGYWQLNAVISFNTNASGSRYILVKKNGTTDVGQVEFVASSASYNAGWYNATYDLVAGDYLEIFGFQNSGGSLAVRGDATAFGMSCVTFTYRGV